MILNALVNYYDRLAAEPEPKVAPFGFAWEKISFCVVLNPNGTLAGFHDLREQVETGGRIKRTKVDPRPLIVPDRGSRSGTLIKANFLWDNTGYVLGADGKGKPERSLAKFEEFRKLQQVLLERVDDPGLQAVCAFLAGWEPFRSTTLEHWVEACDTNLVFQLAGQAAFVHESERLHHAWLEFASSEYETREGESLLTGREERLARLHPLIPGVHGARSSGASIVSFNHDAFESYHKSQSYNAPVGLVDAFRYTEALRCLVNDERRRLRLADESVVNWTGKPTPFEDTFLGIVGLGNASEDQRTVDRVRGFFKRVQEAIAGDNLDDADVPFYVLGLSPLGRDNPRFSVRFWLSGTVQEFEERLGRHVADLEIVGPADAPPLTLRRLVLETARPKSGGPDEENVSPLLSGAILRSVLEGTPYPTSLLAAVIQRIRVEGFADPKKRRDWPHAIHRRAAILKAFLIRNGRIQMDVYLNKNHPEKSYHCGRLLAVLAFAQEKALGTVNAGVVRRNFGSVMAMPGLMLGRLQKAAEVAHIPKLDGDLPDFVRDELKSINVALKDSIPAHLDLLSQGVFALGFYQQLQYLDFVGEQVSKRRRYRTTQGDWVRSRLEVRTADALAKRNLPYVYEAVAVLPSAGERWPDFIVRGKDKHDDLYIEVLGMDTPEYATRWELKRSAYEAFGVTESGGANGRLIVLDFRSSHFDENTLDNALRGRIALAAETNQEVTERNLS
jgi:CRISPR-associated protein Csd1